MQPDDLEAVADVIAQAIQEALAPVLERLAVADARLQTLGDLRDRVVTIETKAAMPAPATDLAPVLDRVGTLEREVREDLMVNTAHADANTREIGAVRERLAVVETRAPVPGPPGQDGAHGHDGLNGKDGADGLGFGDLSLLQEDDRTVVLRATRGDGVKELGRLTFPALIYRGVYQEGRSYAKGDVVTWAGSLWVVNEETTTKPGEGSKAYTLAAKKGRDGRDGIDAPGALPVVKVGGR